jgi:phosphoglycerate dehydrogenase-like enzyme
VPDTPSPATPEDPRTERVDDVVTVGILYPPEWYRDDDGFARALERIRAVDPRVHVIAETYVEPHDLRTARGVEPPEAWRDRVPELTDAQRDAFARVDVVVAIDLPPDVATVAPRLRWVQCVGAGTAQLQSAGLGAAGIRLTSGAGVNSIAIAEFAIARVLQHWKRFREFDALQERHEWGAIFGRQVAGATIGLIGLGNINAAVARRLRAFDVRVLATRRSATPGATAPDVDELFPTTELHAMLGLSDAVIAAVPETPDTAALMDAAAFAAMKPGAFFVNVGRWSLVDEAALVAALESGHLAGAALDVASVEPLPPDHALWDAPNVYLSPHASSAPDALFVNLTDLFCANLARYLAGEPLHNEVDATRGY